MNLKFLSVGLLVCLLTSGTAFAEIVTTVSYFGKGDTEPAACQSARLQANVREADDPLIGKVYTFKKGKTKRVPYAITKNSVCDSSVKLLMDQKIPENQWRYHLPEMCVQDAHWECLMDVGFKFVPDQK